MANTSFEDDNRGNHAKTWQFPLKDDRFRTLLRDLAPSVPFTANDVEDLMNPPESLENIILSKYADGTKKMNNADKIRLKNIESNPLLSAQIPLYFNIRYFPNFGPTISMILIQF